MRAEDSADRRRTASPAFWLPSRAWCILSNTTKPWMVVLTRRDILQALKSFEQARQNEDQITRIDVSLARPPATTCTKPAPSM